MLRDQADPRIVGSGDIFDSYPFYGPLNESLPGFKEYGRANPRFQPR